MATMIPSDINDFHTVGEGRFYHFLEQVAKPDEQNIVWYTPDINGREPDLFKADNKAARTAIKF